MITLRQLHYLDALAASRHFGRAAQAANISQPALSMQIRALEDALGGTLVERRPDGATLTELGQEVAARGGHILALIRDLEELPATRAEVLSGMVRLGVIPSVAPYLLPSLLAATGREYPRLRLIIRESVTATLVRELASGSLDAIVASVPLGVDEITEAPAFDDAFMLAARAGSPHSKRKPALADLISADELLLLEDGHCLRDQALAVCAAIDPRRLKSYGATSLSTVLHLVTAGYGITLIPEIAVDAALRADPNLALVPFARPAPSRTIGVAWRKSSPRGRDFRALADLIRRDCAPRQIGTQSRT
jgi:LysR family hydrogen peroxide-inducible transcriptional activator